ncbi:hypothetical protein Q5752_003846 [Cryptotrichosporon argae]
MTDNPPATIAPTNMAPPALPTAQQKPSKTCDNCRKRKIKCVEDAEGSERPCVGCRNLDLECMFDYIRKKPGRKNSFAAAIRTKTEHPETPSRGFHPYDGRPAYSPPLDLLSPRARLARSSLPPASLPLPTDHLTPGLSHSAPRSPFSSFALPSTTGLSWLDSLDSVPFPDLSGFAVDPTLPFPSEQAHLLSLESPENALAGSSTASVGHAGVPRREEDVISWANVSHYVSLYLQYLWPLLPLVHRPTFAENLATRLDLRDTDFRALLLSIVAYTISQLPTSRLVTDKLEVEDLKRLQRRCHRTSQALQRTYHGQVSLTQICIIIFDQFYLLSIGLAHTAAARLGQAVQLAFTLGLHSDARTQALGLDAVEVQLRRRVFWQLYASDKTRAVAGNPMLINDFQGVCSYPEAIDDDFITSQGMFPQPASRPSLLAGFVSVSKLFRVLSECFFHHRCILSELRTIGTDWTLLAEERVHAVLREMPSAIQDPASAKPGLREVFAMQRANILITVAIVKFALYDLRSALDVDEDQLGREREAIAREIHNLLMSIPVEDLASNGESVRGKVFHIACALCGQASTPGTDTGLVVDWCNMFSAISFVQMPPPPPGAVLDSRANSPPTDVPEAALEALAAPASA